MPQSAAYELTMNPFERGREVELGISMSHHSLVGKIRFEPRHDEAAGASVDADSSLEGLLSSFAHRAKLEIDLPWSCDSACQISARRIHWSPTPADDVTVRANIGQLLDDLEAEFQQLESAAR